MAAAAAAPAIVSAQAGRAEINGTFFVDGRPTVGIVLRDNAVVELSAANRDLTLRPQYVPVRVPSDLLRVIGLNDAQLFVQSRPLRVKQLLGLDGSTGSLTSISPLPPAPF